MGKAIANRIRGKIRWAELQIGFGVKLDLQIADWVRNIAYWIRGKIRWAIWEIGLGAKLA